jgi:hypothetical protein
MPIIRVLKPFVYSPPAVAGARTTAEKFFAPGDHEISQEMADHPWIKSTHAEGRIESPEQTQARVKRQMEDAKEANRLAQEATQKAEATFSRLKASEPEVKATEAEIQAELNTPVNVLRENKPNADKIVSELNTPVATLKLRANAGK